MGSEAKGVKVAIGLGCTRLCVVLVGIGAEYLGEEFTENDCAVGVQLCCNILEQFCFGFIIVLTLGHYV